MLELGTESPAEHRHIGKLLTELGLTDALLVGPMMGAAAGECPQAHHAGTKAEAAAWLMANPPQGRRILLKGSRGMGLETLVELL